MNALKINISLICCMIATMAFYELQAQPDHNVTILNDPAPGYLLFDWGANHSFNLIDNYGYNVNKHTSSNGLNAYFYKVLDNGVITAYTTNKYYLYNYDMHLLDSIIVPAPLNLDFHDIINLRNGNYLVLCTKEIVTDLSKYLDGGLEESIVVHNVLLEVDTKGNIYWTWSTENNVSVTDATETVVLDKAYIDLVHMNSIFECNDGDILVSMRHLDEIAKINKATGNFAWRLGGSRCINNQFTFINDNVDGFYGFSHQHAATILANGNLLLYDNGNLKPNAYSRAVEYSINQANKTATKVWEYRSNPDIFMAALGSAYRLSNGNTLINWGKDKITEVKPDKSVAMEITYNSYNVYNARKVTSLSIYSSVNINSNGAYNFNSTPSNTGVTLQVTGIASPLKVHVQKHSYIHDNYSFTDSSFSEIIPLRWVITKDGQSNITGKIRFNTTTINGLKDPKKVTVYKRDKESIGSFFPLNTTYNESTKEIIADFNSLGEFIIVSNLLVKPELLTPCNNDLVQLSGKLTWSTQKGAQKYQIQIDSNVKFSNPSVNAIAVNGTYQYSSLLPRTKFNWRVRALNLKDTTEWSNVFTFTTVNAPIVLSYPENNQQGVMLSDNLKWNKQKNSDSYKLEIATDQNFNDIAVSVVIHELNHYPISKLSNEQKYFWRVAVVENNDSFLWSEVRNFVTTFKAPILSKPENHASVNSNYVNFEWSSLKQVDAYKLEIAYDSLFNQTAYLQSEFSHSIVKNIELNHDTKYFWRVQSRIGEIFSDWSDVFSFNTALNTPIQLFPENAQLNLDTKVEFKWVNNESSYKYRLQLSNKPDFANLFIDSLIDNSDNITISGLAFNTSYYWRIRAITNTNSSNWSTVSRFRIKLTSPKLTSPRNGRTDFSLYSSLKWELSNSKLNYRLQIANDETFENSIIDTVTGSNEYYISALIPMTKYYWRVCAFNDSLISNWSEIRHFVTDDAYGLEAPELLSPLDGSDTYTDGYLVWQDYGDGALYHLQISHNKEFTDIVIDTLELAEDGFRLYSLEHSQVYFWRVRLYSKFAHSDWSEIFSFTTIDQDGIIQLQNPRDYELDVSFDVIFRWEKIAAASFYEFQMSKKPDFKETLINISDIQTNSYKVSDLAASKIYYWRVRFINGNEKSKWSQIWSFVTKSFTSLPVPELIEPEANATSINVVTRFTWDNVEKASHYKFILGKDPNFQKVILKHSYLQYNELHCCELDYNTTYYWKVAAYNDSSYSSWCQVQSFTTELQKPTISYPSCSDTLINPNITIKWSSHNPEYKSHLQIARDSEFVIIEHDIDDISGDEYVCNLTHNSEYFLRVKSYNSGNSSRWSKPLHIRTLDIESSIHYIRLSNAKIFNHPNPCEHFTIFALDLDIASNVILQIYNLNGVKITTLLNQHIDVGIYKFTWDTDSVESGIYYYKLITDNENKTGIISIIK